MRAIVTDYSARNAIIGLTLVARRAGPPSLCELRRGGELILFKLKRVLYWGDADQRMDFTTMNDTAVFTASAALDPYTPRFLRIAGDELSARELTTVVSEVTGKQFRLFRAGGLEALATLIKVVRTVAPGEKALFPAWQGMQYMHNMFDGRAKLEPFATIAIPVLVGRLRGMCSQPSKLDSLHPAKLSRKWRTILRRPPGGYLR